MNILVLLLCAGWIRPVALPAGTAELDAFRRVTADVAASATRDPQPATRNSPADAVPGQFVVGYEPADAAAVKEWLAGAGFSILRDDAAGRFLVVRTAQDAPVEAARSVPGVRFAEPDLRVHADAIPNDPFFLQYQWDKWVMYADEAWDLNGGSVSIKVAVVDNGCEYTHPDLAGSFQAGELGYDFISNDPDPRPDHPDWDEAFHGTHVAGIIAATRDNGQGVAGWALVQLLSVRVLDDSGSGNTSTLATGIRWAADHGARVINMSLGGTSSTTPVDEACQHAAAAGVLLAAASGNEGIPLINFPAGLNECVAVGATDKDSRLASFSNYGSQQELVAPGVDVASTVTGSAYALASGTSMATPEVSGVAALVFAAHPAMTGSQVRSILAASAIDMGSSGRDATYGYGLVNGRRALELAALLERRGLDVPNPQPAVGHPPLVAGSLPSWVARATAFDGSGRVVSRWQRGEAELRLGPGVYFLALSGAGRSEVQKAVVAR